MAPYSDIVITGWGPQPGEVGGSSVTDSSGAPLTGDAFYQQLAQQRGTGYADSVKGIVEGRARYPEGFFQKTPYGQAMMRDAFQMDPTLDANKINQRKTFWTQMGSNSASSFGGQSKAFNQGIVHLEDLAKTLEELHNSGGMGIPVIARGINTARQELDTQQNAIANKAAGIAQTLAGETGKLFSGSAGGGVHEREATASRFNTTQSNPEMAGSLEAQIEMMMGGLNALQGRRDELGIPASAAPFITPETQARIERIKGIIAKLRGDQQAAPSPMPSTPATPQVQSQEPAQGGGMLEPGQSTTINGIVIRRVK